MAEVDEVFKALADPTRRELLDELFADDGQTLGTLEEKFSMTRFGVMKHIDVLREAGITAVRLQAGTEDDVIAGLSQVRADALIVQWAPVTAAVLDAAPR